MTDTRIRIKRDVIGTRGPQNPIYSSNDLSIVCGNLL